MFQISKDYSTNVMEQFLELQFMYIDESEQVA